MSETTPPATVLVLYVLSETDQWSSIADIQQQIAARTDQAVHRSTIRNALEEITADNLQLRFDGLGQPATEYRLVTE